MPIGSSPRVWGTSNDRSFWERVHRFIPTCVGNIAAYRRGGRMRAVHPHVCGEHREISSPNSFMAGSSPRVWGTWLRAHVIDNIVRFIPTCVGNISLHFTVAFCITVHPHVCGEHDSGSCLTINSDGSSPRVWGTFSSSSGSLRPFRFIPTCVGNMT